MHLAIGGMAETDANLASGSKNSTPQKITRRKRNPNQTQQKRTKHSKTTGPDGLVEPGEQNHLVSPPGEIEEETSNAAAQILKSNIDTTSDNFTQQEIIQKMVFDQREGDKEQLKEKIQSDQLQEQFLLPTLEIDRACYQQQRNQLIQNASLQNSSTQSSDDGSKCYQRVNQYILHLRNRPKNNNIEFWRKFVSEFYASCATERWCLSAYEQPAFHSFSFRAIEAWSCDICGIKSGKGFEASFEILPRVLQMRFESGELEEIMHLEFPQVYKLKPGIIMLEYGKAVLQTSYEQFHVAREGKLRVFLRNDLKILSLQFCAHQHEEFLPRRLVAPQVNQLINAANQYQNSIYAFALGELSEQHLQENDNLFFISGHQLTSFLDLSMMDDLGLSGKHVRCLEMAEVVNIMKDLMDFSFERNIGPIESLQTYPCVGNKTSIRETMQTNEQETAEQGSIRSTTAMDLGPDGYYNHTFMNSDRSFTVSGDHTSSVLPDYYRELQRQNMLNTMASTTRSEQSFLMNQFGQGVPPYLVRSNNPGQNMLNTMASTTRSEQSFLMNQFGQGVTPYLVRSNNPGQNMLNTMASTTRSEQSFLMNQFDQGVTPYLVRSNNPGQNMLNTMASTTRSEQSFLMNQFGQGVTPYLVQSNNPGLLHSSMLRGLSTSDLSNIIRRYNMDAQSIWRDMGLSSSQISNLDDLCRQYTRDRLQGMQQLDTNTSRSQPAEGQWRRYSQ